MSIYTAENSQDLQDIIKVQSRLVIRAGGSKTALSSPPESAHLLDMSKLRGIIEYEPGEYTFTAFAATPLKEIMAALTEHGQYLPFDPVLVEDGATLGGTVAANTSGSGRYRFGAVRDFILGIRFVDGNGNLVRSGGKVVKNAAGFDLSKFMVGSLGHYGALLELSFKVFPQPSVYHTLALSYPDTQSALEAIFALSTSPLEMDALDFETGDAFTVLIRIGGLEKTLAGRIERLKAFLQQKVPYSKEETLLEDQSRWQHINHFAWAGDAANIVKIPIAPRQMPELDAQCAAIHAKRHYSAAANSAWVALEETEPLEKILVQMNCTGLHIKGQFGQPIIGKHQGQAIYQRMKQALDPTHSFWSNLATK